MDTDGRVMRVDSFSKIMAPGMRLGWITSNFLFHEALVTLTDSSTHHPHAFGQIFITEMLSKNGWNISGFDRWVRSLRDEYKRRRDFFVNAFYGEFAPTGYASAELPEAGMFVWMKIHLKKHPRFRILKNEGDSSPGPRTNTKELMEELFERCLDGGVVVMPASVFLVPEAIKTTDKDCIEDVSNLNHGHNTGTDKYTLPAIELLPLDFRGTRRYHGPGTPDSQPRSQRLFLGQKLDALSERTLSKYNS